MSWPVNDNNPYMNDFQLNDLLSATELDRIRTAVQGISQPASEGTRRQAPHEHPIFGIQEGGVLVP